MLATIGLTAVGMAATTWWGPDLLGKQAWVLPHDLWGTLAAAQRLVHLDLSGLYTPPTGLISFPGAALILVPVVAVIDAAGLGLLVPGAQNTQPGAWLVAGPYAIALCSRGAVCRRLDRRAPGGNPAAARRCSPRRRRSRCGASRRNGVIPRMPWRWDCCCSVLALSEPKPRRAAWLIGAAVAVQPLVLLALPVVLAVIEPRRLPGFLARAAVPAALLLAAAAAANWNATIKAVTSQPNWPALDHRYAVDLAGPAAEPRGGRRRAGPGPGHPRGVRMRGRSWVAGGGGGGSWPAGARTHSRTCCGGWR